MRNIIATLCLLFAFPAFPATNTADVEFGTNSVILNVDLYDRTAPEDCPATDLTHGTQDLNITLFDDVTNGQLDFFECTGAACVTTDTIEDITTLGTYATPTANNVRFKVKKAGSCWYELQFEDAIFDTTNIKVLSLEITAPGIIDGNFWVDMTPVSSTTLVDLIWDKVCTSPVAGSVREQMCNDIDAILIDTSSTLHNNLLTAITNSSRAFMYDAVILTVTNQLTFIVDTPDDPGNTDQHIGRMLCVIDISGVKSEDCARIGAYNTATQTWTIETPLVFTVVAGDIILIRPPSGIGRLESLVLVSGVTDSGTTASFVDAALTQSTSNHWAKNTAVIFISGSNKGQTFCVIGFVPGSDTINFSPLATNSVGTDEYLLMAAPGCDPFR